LLQSPKRGWLSITNEGKQVLSAAPDKIDVKFLMQFPEFSAFYSGSGDVTSSVGPQVQGSTAQTPEELIEGAHRALDAELRTELLNRILQGSPAFFENLIVDLLLAMGYGGSRRDAAKQLGKSGDGGVDGVINEDVLGLDRIYVQAKRYAPTASVGRPDVQAFTGSLVGMGASKGVFVTTSSFSAQAIDYVGKIPHRIVLIDGTRLTEMMVLYGVGVRVSQVLEFKRVDGDFFAEEL
jgi:restriction system protein